MRIHRCGDCKYFAEAMRDVKTRVTICRRFPPTVVVLEPDQGGVIATVYPETEEDAYCGEFRALLLSQPRLRRPLP